MKKILYTIVLLLFAIYLYAQPPKAFQYQGIARNSMGSPIANQNISIRISILQNTPNGSIIYVETHSPTSNNYGLFTIQIGSGSVSNGNFNSISWGQNSHFIKVEMDETGGFVYQDMGTTQLLAVPYALHAETVTNKDDADANPNNELQTLSINGSQLSISNGNTISLPNTGGSNNSLDAAYDAGRQITADAGEIDISCPSNNSTALHVHHIGTGMAVEAAITNANNNNAAVQGTTNSNSNAAAAIIGNSSNVAYGVAGQVLTNATAESAVFGSNLRTNGGTGVLGVGFDGIKGETGQSTGYGVYGENFDNIAPLGSGIGVCGLGYNGVYGQDMYNGTVAGSYGVFSNGNLGASGVKTFKIDHPTDPENKYLRHFSVESDEVLNIYRGTVTFDANGDAIVQLADYVKAINKNETYQLTPIGVYMQLYIKEKLDEENKFIISGGMPGKEVSWAMFGERNDLYLQKNPQQRTVELEKRSQEKGKYLLPNLYDATDDKAIVPKRNKKFRPVLNTSSK